MQEKNLSIFTSKVDLKVLNLIHIGCYVLYLQLNNNFYVI